LTNYDTKITTLNIVAIIVDFEEYIKNGYFNINEYITINKKHKSYEEYNEKKNKCLETVNYIFCNLNLHNKQHNEIKGNKHDDFDISIEHNHNDNSNSEDSQEEDDEDIEYQDNDHEDEEYKQDKSSSVKNLSQISNEDNIFILRSLTNFDKFYFINTKLTLCSCESFRYCKKTIKDCKHLQELNNNFHNHKLLIINKNDKTCNCTRFISHKSCKHITALNKNYLMNYF